MAQQAQQSGADQALPSGFKTEPVLKSGETAGGDPLKFGGEPRTYKKGEAFLESVNHSSSLQQGQRSDKNPRRLHG